MTRRLESKGKLKREEMINCLTKSGSKSIKKHESTVADHEVSYWKPISYSYLLKKKEEVGAKKEKREKKMEWLEESKLAIELIKVDPLSLTPEKKVLYDMQLAKFIFLTTLCSFLQGKYPFIVVR